ncbi:hypothetical protein EON64_13095 [archaeon]|nr:MAG: hypothetical protein EON64_13095 [archaeon]
MTFFGEPRSPPPPSAAFEPAAQGLMLRWARHASVVPCTARDREQRVFPRGRAHDKAAELRLKDSVSFEQILEAFKRASFSLRESKDFIEVNADVVPPLLFLRALTAHKLRAQSKNALSEMQALLALRASYLLAYDQVFFPLLLEVRKAETRVMTYLDCGDLQEAAGTWDSTELSLYLLMLLAARLVWSRRAAGTLRSIEQGVSESLAEELRMDLMTRDYAGPGSTASLFRNASMSFQLDSPQLYAKVRPEVQLLHETCDLMSKPDVVQ